MTDKQKIKSEVLKEEIIEGVLKVYEPKYTPHIDYNNKQNWGWLSRNDIKGVMKIAITLTQEKMQKLFEEKIKEIKIKYREKWETTSISQVWWENMLDELLTSISGAGK